MVGYCLWKSVAIVSNRAQKSPPPPGVQKVTVPGSPTPGGVDVLHAARMAVLPHNPAKRRNALADRSPWEPGCYVGRCMAHLVASDARLRAVPRLMKRPQRPYCKRFWLSLQMAVPEVISSPITLCRAQGDAMAGEMLGGASDGEKMGGDIQITPPPTASGGVDTTSRGPHVAAASRWPASNVGSPLI